MGLYGQEAKVNHLLSLPQRAPSLSSANAACKHLIEIRRSPGEIAQGQSETGGESEREKGDTSWVSGCGLAGCVHGPGKCPITGYAFGRVGGLGNRLIKAPSPSTTPRMLSVLEANYGTGLFLDKVGVLIPGTS